MRYAAAKKDNALGFARITLALFAMLAWLPPSTASAQTAVSASVCGASAPASLSITSPFAGQVFSSSSIRIEGTVNNLSQIRVFVDGVYRETIPLDSGATVFTHEQVLDPGSHTIRLEGIDVCQQTNPVAEVEVAYDAAVVPVGPGVPGGTPAQTPSSPAASPQAGEQMPPETTPPRSPVAQGIVGSMLDGIYKSLVVLDIAHPDKPEELPKSLGRAFLTTAGVSMFVLAQPIMAAYTFISGKIAATTGAFAAPAVLRPRAVIIARIAGAALVVIGLFAIR